MSNETVLYDHPGPRAKVRNLILTIVFGLALLGLLYWLYAKFDEKGQWNKILWEPFLQADTWNNFILPGLWGTLKAAATGMVLALIFGLVFSIARLSEHRWVRIPAGAIVEFFRAVPLLLMIFFVLFGVPYLIDRPVPAVLGGRRRPDALQRLRARRGVPGRHALGAVAASPRRRTRSACARAGVMRYILVPQAARAMLPVIVSQLVVLLKDTALGYIVAYPELLQLGVNVVSANYGNVVQAAIVIALIYIIINSILTMIAGWLERRTRRSGIRVPRGVPGRRGGRAAGLRRGSAAGLTRRLAARGLSGRSR